MTTKPHLSILAERLRPWVTARWRAGRDRWQEVRADVRAGLAQGAIAGLVVVVIALPVIALRPKAPPPLLPFEHGGLSASERPAPARRADFTGEEVSDEARIVADWVARSGDNGGRPFAILDKRGARLFVFEPGARLVGTTLVLLGSARGDESAPGIGDKPLALIQAHERTTPAGRFISEPGRDTYGEQVVWVDYDGAVAMHRVRVVDPKERRFERIATPRIDDKRISNGCINVPIDFFDGIVAPWLLRSTAVVYILPEVKALHEVFRLRDGALPPAQRALPTIPRRSSDIG